MNNGNLWNVSIIYNDPLVVSSILSRAPKLLSSGCSMQYWTIQDTTNCTSIPQTFTQNIGNISDYLAENTTAAWFGFTGSTDGGTSFQARNMYSCSRLVSVHLSFSTPLCRRCTISGCRCRSPHPRPPLPAQLCTLQQRPAQQFYRPATQAALTSSACDS